MNLKESIEEGYKLMMLVIMVLVLVLVGRTISVVNKIDDSVTVVNEQIEEIVNLSFIYAAEEYGDDAKELGQEAIDSVKARAKRLLNLKE